MAVQTCGWMGAEGGCDAGFSSIGAAVARHLTRRKNHVVDDYVGDPGRVCSDCDLYEA